MRTYRRLDKYFGLNTRFSKPGRFNDRGKSLLRKLFLVPTRRQRNADCDAPASRILPNKIMKTNTDNKQVSQKNESSWGAKLFYITLMASLAFFWWLLIYSHGVSPIHH
jgi:hypothetical protein